MIFENNYKQFRKRTKLGIEQFLLMSELPLIFDKIENNGIYQLKLNNLIGHEFKTAAGPIRFNSKLHNINTKVIFRNLSNNVYYE